MKAYPGTNGATELLPFEEPIGELLKELDRLRLLPSTEKNEGEIEKTRTLIEDTRRDIYKNLTSWDRVLVARHPQRPSTLDYIEQLFTGFTELHGDRRFGDDHAIVSGFAFFDGNPVLVVGHQKGRDIKQKVFRNFGYAQPEGYRKALRTMKVAEKFGRPIVVFIDTPAAYPGIGSEERGISEAIANNLREMALLTVPVIIVISGEGGSGGALAIAVGDRILMQEFAIYTVIPPEGCAAILWRNVDRKMEAAAALKITASDLIAMKIIDEIITEPCGGAHTDKRLAAELIAKPVKRALLEVSMDSSSTRVQKRYDKFRQMGNSYLSIKTSTLESKTID